jgi:hypothetical protein
LFELEEFFLNCASNASTRAMSALTRTSDFMPQAELRAVEIFGLLTLALVLQLTGREARKNRTGETA